MTLLLLLGGFQMGAPPVGSVEPAQNAATVAVEPVAGAASAN